MIAPPPDPATWALARAVIMTLWRLERVHFDNYARPAENDR